jgi:hypothetical protein
MDEMTQQRFEQRLAAVEKSCAEIHTLFGTFKDDLNDKLDNITVFVTGANTIFGLARRHWKRVFIFGAGVMTSAGFGNPKVWAFISSFAGG